MRKLLALSLGTFAIGAAFTGCGSGTEPFSGLGDPGTTPLLALPLSDTLISTGSGQFVAGTNDGFDFQNSGISQNVVAPADGFVTNVDPNLNTGFSAVTIYHNVHLSTRVSRIQTPSVSVGNFVKAGSQIGASASVALGNFTHFTVYFDGTAVCPVSYLNSNEQKFLVGHFSGGNFPCQ